MSKQTTTVTPAQVQETIQQVYNFYKSDPKGFKADYRKTKADIENPMHKIPFVSFMFVMAAVTNDKDETFNDCCRIATNYLHKNYTAIMSSREKGKNITEHIFGYLYHSLNQYIDNE